MPLGNLTSQLFANIYLNELDQFVKHHLKVRYYIRYVDDFLILHPSKKQLEQWKEEINTFLKEKLHLELHPDKSKIISLGRPVPFVGFRVRYYHKLLKKSNRKNILRRIDRFYQLYAEKKMSYDKIYESMQGTFAYIEHGNTYRLRKKIARNLRKKFPGEISSLEINSYIENLKKQELVLKYLPHLQYK